MKVILPRISFIINVSPCLKGATSRFLPPWNACQLPPLFDLLGHLKTPKTFMDVAYFLSGFSRSVDPFLFAFPNKNDETKKCKACFTRETDYISRKTIEKP